MNLLIAIIIILIIIVMLFICWIIRRIPIWGNNKLTYYQKCARNSFNKIQGENWNDANQEVIDYVTSVPEEHKNAYDYFMIGATHLYAHKNPANVVQSYNNAINAIRGGTTDDDLDAVIRIRDHVFYNMEDFAYTELFVLHDDLEWAIENSFKTASKSTKVPVDGSRSALIESKAPDIKIDSQNVHDSAITLEFSKQYKKLRVYNGHSLMVLNDNDPDIKYLLNTLDQSIENEANLVAHAEFLTWMKKTITDSKLQDELNRRFVNDYTMIDRLDGNIKIPERDVIAAVWRRIHAGVNTSNKTQLIEALTSRLYDCFDYNKNVVCTTGRAEQIISALAYLDADPELGLFRTSDIIKGDIYTKASKILSDELNTISKCIRDAYNMSEVDLLSENDRSILNRVISNVSKQIDMLAIEFKGKIPDIDIAVIINDIKKEL